MAKEWPRYRKEWMSATGLRILDPPSDAARITQDAVDDAVHLLVGRFLAIPDDMHISLATFQCGGRTTIIACATGCVERRVKSGDEEAP